MITIATVVEGQGEVQALPVLLRRLAAQLRPAVAVDVPRPFRLPRGQIGQPEQLGKAVRFVSQRVVRGGVLVLADADDDCPVALAARLRGPLLDLVPCPVAVVLAEREYEAWFLASLQSLAAHRDVADGALPLSAAETVRDAKGALGASMPHAVYRETRHQTAFSQITDLDQAAACRSFRKLVSDVATLLDG